MKYPQKVVHKWQYMWVFEPSYEMQDVWVLRLGIFNIHTMPEMGYLLSKGKHFKGFFLVIKIGWRHSARVALLFQTRRVIRQIPLVPLIDWYFQ